MTKSNAHKYGWPSWPIQSQMTKSNDKCHLAQISNGQNWIDHFSIDLVILSGRHEGCEWLYSQHTSIKQWTHFCVGPTERLEECLLFVSCRPIEMAESISLFTVGNTHIAFHVYRTLADIQNQSSWLTHKPFIVPFISTAPWLTHKPFISPATLLTHKLSSPSATLPTHKPKWSTQQWEWT